MKSKSFRFWKLFCIYCMCVSTFNILCLLKKRFNDLFGWIYETKPGIFYVDRWKLYWKKLSLTRFKYMFFSSLNYCIYVFLYTCNLPDSQNPIFMHCLYNQSEIQRHILRDRRPGTTRHKNGDEILPCDEISRFDGNLFASCVLTDLCGNGFGLADSINFTAIPSWER